MIKKLIIKILFHFSYFLQRRRFFSTKTKKKLFRIIFKNKIKEFNSEIIIDPKIGYITVEHQNQKEIKPIIEKCIRGSLEIFKNKNFSTGSKTYLRNILHENQENEIKNFLSFFLNEWTINIVGKYLKTEPLLVELKLLYSPILQDDHVGGSQLFHCDYDDDKIVKIFLNIFDVHENSGPLEALTCDNTHMLKKKYNINLGEHLKKIENNISVSELKKFIGKKGDLTLIDTSNCLHRGSLKTKKERLILYGNFVSRSSYRFIPIFRKLNDFNIKKLHSPLSIYTHLVGDKQQKFLINN